MGGGVGCLPCSSPRVWARVVEETGSEGYTLSARNTGTRPLRTPLLSFAAQTLCRAHSPPEKQVRENSIGNGIRKPDVLVSALMSRGENLHGTINTSAMWGTVQRQMLKFECPVKVGGWAGHDKGRAGLGKPGNVRTEQRKWSRVFQEGRRLGHGQQKKAPSGRNGSR